MYKDLLTLRDMSCGELEELFELSTKLKKERGSVKYTPLAGKSIGLIFAKSSTRTRVSFEVGVGELGGQPLYLDQSKMQVGRGETVADTANVLSRYLHGIVIRTFAHSDVESYIAMNLESAGRASLKLRSADLPPKIPLSQNKEFKSIKNEIIRDLYVIFCKELERYRSNVKIIPHDSNRRAVGINKVSRFAKGRKLFSFKKCVSSF